VGSNQRGIPTCIKESCMDGGNRPSWFPTPEVRLVRRPGSILKYHTTTAVYGKVIFRSISIKCRTVHDILVNDSRHSSARLPVKNSPTKIWVCVIAYISLITKIDAAC